MSDLPPLDGDGRDPFPDYEYIPDDRSAIQYYAPTYPGIYDNTQYTLYTPLGPVTHTKAEWMNELLLPKEELLYRYELDNLDLIGNLTNYNILGYEAWTDDDWAAWREAYELANG